MEANVPVDAEFKERAAMFVDRYMGYEGGDLPWFTHDTLRAFVCFDCEFPMEAYNRIAGTKRQRLKEAIKRADEATMRRIIQGILDRGGDEHSQGDSTKTDARTRLMAMVNSLDGVAPIQVANPAESVQRALDASETLIRNHGPSQGIDRLHTALHAYLRHHCEAAQIAFQADDTIQKLAKLLREQHVALSRDTGLPTEPKLLVERLASVFEILNIARNRAEGAHPNPPLPNPEANLVLNAAKTMFHYLESRLR